MHIVCLDLEGVLIPEIWIAFAKAVGIPEFNRTTRDEPDYAALMRYRIALLKQHNLKLPDIKRVINEMSPLDGAAEFARLLRERTQLIILSDTYEEFAQPFMVKLAYPVIFCNSLITTPDGCITGHQLRQEDGKKRAVTALKSLNFRVFAAGDSFNDLTMIREADDGCLFRAPPAIKDQCGDLSSTDTYSGLLARIDTFLS
jgi:phosphoserine/homoserine phosphotransferase